MKKPRPQKRLRQGRRAPTFDSALLPTQYRVLMITWHLASIPEQLGRVISEHFVVKTTRRSKVAPFDVLLDICRPHHAPPALIQLPSQVAQASQVWTAAIFDLFIEKMVFIATI